MKGYEIFADDISLMAEKIQGVQKALTGVSQVSQKWVSEDCSLLSGSLALEALLFGVH